ncbi:MAG: hypothetical protein QM820_33925 [Minicystis sp.]
MVNPRRVLTAALALAALMASGCEKKIAAVCEEKCGSAAQTCVDSTAQDEATAEERGCEGEFEAYASCADAKATCTSGVLDTTACAAEITALTACKQ